MIIGIPKEIKNNEYRVGMGPAGVRQLVQHGHEVWIESGAGLGSRFRDSDYEAVGGKIVPTAVEAWSANMVIKVKEPQASEYSFMREDLTLFTYLHLAAEESLTKAMMDTGVLGIAYETVEARDGSLPLLTPMSEVAGRMAIQVGAHWLERSHGGRGKLLGGVTGTQPARVMIIGGGIVGTNAAQMALGMGAQVTILDSNLERLRYLDQVLHGRLITLASNAYNIHAEVKQADLVVGSVLIKGAKAPKLITRDMLSEMQEGSVIVDVAVDQGGCIETTHVTTHDDPVYVVDGVLHYGVANMPGAVPRTSTIALNNATLPYALRLADMGAQSAVLADPGLAAGVNTYQGQITYAAVAEAFDLPYQPLADSGLLG